MAKDVLFVCDSISTRSSSVTQRVFHEVLTYPIRGVHVWHFFDHENRPPFANTRYFQCLVSNNEGSGGVERPPALVICVRFLPRAS